MKKLLIFLLIFLPKMSYGFVNTAASNYYLEQQNKIRHENNYHNGKLVVFDSKIKEEVTKEKSVFISYKYRLDYYCFEEDPDKCIEKIDKILIEKRNLNSEEIAVYKRHEKIEIWFLAIVIILTGIFSIAFGIALKY